jgi:hypothetical protein
MRGSELISEFLKHSPFVGHLGIEIALPAWLTAPRCGDDARGRFLQYRER